MASSVPESASEQPVWPSLWSTLPDQVWLGVAVAVILFLGWLYLGLIDTELLGFTHDDGVYAVAGKALATGQGFTLLHVVGQPAQVKYPIVYPLILALVWLINPQFPQNLPLMSDVTIAFTVASFWLIFVFARQAMRLPAWAAIAAVVLSATGYFFMYFHSMIMSEAPYLFFSLLTLWVLARQSAREGPLSLKSVVLVTALSMITFHTRVLGLSLIAGIGTWLLARCQWKNAVIYGAGTLLLTVLPWMLWTHSQTPPLTTLNFPLVNAYSNYGDEFFHNYTAGNFSEMLGLNILAMIQKLLENMFPVLPNFLMIYPQWEDIALFQLLEAGMTLGGMFLLAVYFIGQSVSSIWRNGRNGLTPAALYVFFYLLVILIWNYGDQFARFATPLMPLLWLFFLNPFVAAIRRWPVKLRNPATWLMPALCFLLCLLAMWHFPNSYKLSSLSRSHHWVVAGRKYEWLWGDYNAAFAFLRRNTAPDAPLATGVSDATFYLYTGRPTFYTFKASLPMAHGRYLKDAYARLMRSMDHYHVQYLVAEPHMEARVWKLPVSRIAHGLLMRFPERFQQVYTSPHQAITIYRILPQVATEPSNAQ